LSYPLQLLTTEFLADEALLVQEQCVKRELVDDDERIITYNVCLNVETGKTLCENTYLPFDSWFQNVSIFKSCYEQKNCSAIDSNSTRLNSCDPTWQEHLAQKYRFCNASVTDRTVRQHSNGIIEPSYLQALIWIMAALALTGNMGILINNFMSLKNKYQTMISEKKVNLILMTNLAFADFLMCVCLLCISVIAAVFTGSLGRIRFLLSMTPFCNFIGAVCFVSSQMSATAIIMTSSSRLFSVICPYKRINVRVFLFLSAVCWLVWIVFACLPLVSFNSIRKAFETVIVPGCSRYQRAVRYSYPNIRQILDSFVMHINSQCATSSKQSLRLSESANGPLALSIAQHLLLLDQKPFFLSFYSQNNLCMPPFFLDSKNPSQYFVLFALCFNFAGFMYVLLAYVFIFNKVLGEKRAPRRARQVASQNQGATLRTKENQFLQRKIQFIVASDFLSVVPMTILALAHYIYFYDLQVRDICDEALELTLTKSVFSTIAVPINSALNPFIYAFPSIKANLGRLRYFMKKKANQENNVPHAHSSKFCELPQRLND